MASIGVNGRHYSRDSFDRFGDDLCEELLSYLSLDSKTVFECVAKQWFRTIHNRQTLLGFHCITGNKKAFYNEIYDSDGQSVPFVVTDNAEDDCKRLVCLLKKYTNIETIEWMSVTIERSVVEVLADFCQRLTALSFAKSNLSDEVVDGFGLMFGHTVRRIAIDSPLHVSQQLLDNFTRVHSLDCKHFSVFDNYSEEFLPNLKSLKCSINANNVSIFGDFCRKYGKQLKRLTLNRDDCLSNDPITSHQLIDILHNVSQLTAIEEFRLSFSNSRAFNSIQAPIDIKKQIKRIALNCKSMTQFGLTLDRSHSLDGNVWLSLAAFQSLQRLSVSFEMTRTAQSIACLGVKHNLKSLVIHSEQVGDKFFYNIHNFLPNLVSFDLTTKCDLTDNLLISLSKLKHLKSLSLRRLWDNLKNITDSGVERVLDNCPEILKLKFDFRTGITINTIKKLIAIAKQRPKQSITFLSTNYDPKNEIDIPYIKLNVIKKIPNNLRIEIITEWCGGG